MVDKKLLEIIACPECKNDVILNQGKIVCTGCGKKYPIKDNIPIMMVEEAELNEDQK